MFMYIIMQNMTLYGVGNQTILKMVLFILLDIFLRLVKRVLKCLFVIWCHVLQYSGLLFEI